MRSATLAKLALTATVGIGALTGSAELASAGDGPVIKAGPTTTTTVKPIPADPADYCEVHLCIEAEPSDPQPDPPHDPDLPIGQPEDDDDCPAQMPNCDKAPPPQDDDDPSPFDNDLPLDNPDPGCNTTHGCDPEPECPPITCDLDDGDPGDGPDDPGDPEIPSDECDDALDPQAPAEMCEAPGDEPVDEPGDEPGDDDSDRGGLPRTGASLAALGALGLGLTGVGAAVKRATRR